MRKSKLSWYKQSRLIELFVAGSTARTAASLVGVNKTTAVITFIGYECLFTRIVKTLVYLKAKSK